MAADIVIGVDTNVIVFDRASAVTAGFELLK
jgi:hypothetical protein